MMFALKLVALACCVYGVCHTHGDVQLLLAAWTTLVAIIPAPVKA